MSDKDELEVEGSDSFLDNEVIGGMRRAERDRLSGSTAVNEDEDLGSEKKVEDLGIYVGKAGAGAGEMELEEEIVTDAEEAKVNRKVSGISNVYIHSIELIEVADRLVLDCGSRDLECQSDGNQSITRR